MKKKVMQHLICMQKIGGPATGLKLLNKSNLSSKYDFVNLYQNEPAGILNIRLFKKMISQIRKERPDVVHIRGLHTDGLYGVLAAKIAGCKNIVLSVHGLYGDLIGLSLMKKIIFNKIVEPLTLRLADRVYCVCHYAANRDIIKKNTKKNFYGVIYNMAPDFDISQKSFFRINTRREFNFEDDETIVTYVGRVTIDKGMKVLENVIEINKLNKKIKFLIVGSGDYLNFFKHNMRLNENVIFLGNRNDIINILSASDIFVFPTLHENLSNVLLEASSVGLPIIATNVGGNSEVIIDKKSGILVPANNSLELSNALNRLLVDTKLMTKLGMQARKNVGEKFSKVKILEDIDRVYSF